MRVEDSKGNQIDSIDAWELIYDNPQQRHHWKEHRSAYSVAEYILNRSGGSAIQSRVSEALGCSVRLIKAIPEYEVKFDKFGRGRVHDLGIFGETDSGRTVFVGIEAKVDEKFGNKTKDEYLKAKAKQIVGKPTNAPQRIEQLLALHFDQSDPAMFNTRYQLLYSTVGTTSVNVDIPVLYVLVFKTPLYDGSIGATNYRDYLQFIEGVGAEDISITSKEAVGHKLRLGDRELVSLYEYIQY